MANGVRELERARANADLERLSGRSGEDDLVAPPIAVLKRRRRSRRPLVLAVVLLAAASVGAWQGYRWWTDGRFMVWTDDAYVSAKTATLAAKVPGYVASLNVEDNAPVHAGDIIATIDDGDYKLAVDAAREKVATQQAAVDRFGQQILAQQSNIDQAKAQVLSARAADKKNQLEFERQQALA